MSFRPDRLRLALPEGRDLPMLVEQLRRCGFELPEMNHPGLFVAHDPIGVGVDFEVFRLAPDDVGTYVQHGISQLGVMSTELLRESGAEVWRPYTFSYGSYPLVLAAPQGISLDSLDSRSVVRLATSLPGLTRDVFASRGMNVEVVPVEDSSTACMLGLADGFIERLVDVEMLVQQGFRVLEVLGYARLKLLINRAYYAARHTAIDEFITRLGANQPEPPAPIEIPFDLDD